LETQTIKYIPTNKCKAEWVRKDGLMKIYDDLNINTLNKWLSEMRKSEEYSKYVINPTYKLTWINLKGFSKFLNYKKANAERLHRRYKKGILAKK
jgi:hypothetical protein